MYSRAVCYWLKWAAIRDLHSACPTVSRNKRAIAKAPSLVSFALPTAPIAPSAALILSATSCKASSHVAGCKVPSRRTIGWAKRLGLSTHSRPKRSRSEIQHSLIASLSRGMTRTKVSLRWPTKMLVPQPSTIEIVGVFFSSQTRARKRNAREVSAPTGQISMVLPRKFGIKGRVAQCADVSFAAA